EMALEAINTAVPATIGGSADLTGSNNTKTKALEPLTADNYAGRYIYYGIREFGMAAAMNGMALHGGVIPYGGTFLVFTDYARPAIRLSALQRARVIYVMTHDSIGLGEDGPTHQPIEHLQSLRAMPQLMVYRPADAVETAECCALALTSEEPSILALTRQNLPPDVSNRDILRVSIEAGTTFGWERYTGLHGLRIGIDRFGVSAPAPDAYKHFGLTPEKVATRITDFMRTRGIE